MAKGTGFTQIEELLIVDTEIVRRIETGCDLFHYLYKLVEAKAAGVVSEMFVIDCLAAAPVVGDDGVKYILDRTNWRLV